MNSYRPPTLQEELLPIRVLDEFGKLRTAIVHDGRNAVDVTMDDWRLLLPPEDLLKYAAAGPSSKKRLREQHGRLRKLLTDNGVSVLSPQAQKGAFGQVFARDPCFAIGETLFIGGLSDEWRLSEHAGLDDIRARFERVVDLSGDGARIEGGDVMVLDACRSVLIGMNEHTEERGFRKLSEALAESGIEPVPVPHETVHLDCCLAPLPNGEALYASALLPDSSVSKVARYFSKLTALDGDEAARHLAANIFWLDRQRVVTPVAARKTNALLREKGYDVIELDFSDVISLLGSVRCVVCPIERD